MQGYFESPEQIISEFDPVDFGEDTPNDWQSVTEYLDDQGIGYMGLDAVEESYQESLDEQGPVMVGNLEFSPSTILEELDPIAYRCGLYDYADALSEDLVVLDY